MHLNQAALDQFPPLDSLYDPAHEHDACGVGFVAQVSGRRSNQILRLGLQSLCHLVHRGALDADAKTGDGAGILTQIPHKLFAADIARLGQQLYNDRDLGVGFAFLPHDNAYAQARAKAITEEILKKRGLFLFGWRAVPLHLGVLGDTAQLTMPRLEQALIGRPWGLSDDDFERRLFLARNEIEKRAAEDKIRNFYLPSFSSRVIVYKGLLVSPALEKFYVDLSSKDYETALCVYHQRYSTNTFPTWPLAHPFRMTAHNGEINTIRGNRNWMHAREAELRADFWGEDIDLLKPIIQPGGSDSASLDNALEALVMSGRSLTHAMTMLVPPAWKADPTVSPEIAAFYQYNACFNEPWDGPAALVFSDGRTVAACLDRNGLRPARFKLTDDGIFALGSEVGATALDDLRVIEKGRLGPGEMIAVDTVAGRLLRDAEIKDTVARQRPYRRWLSEHLVKLEDYARDQAGPADDVPLDLLTLTQRQTAFGYSSEELDLILKPMIRDAAEPVGSMGDDTPLAVLSLQPRLLYSYFKQLFAQVTNPPIDPIREKLVMSLTTIMGWRRNLLAESPHHAELVTADSPILTPKEFAALGALPEPHRCETISVLWPSAAGADGLERQLETVCRQVEAAVDAGARLVVLSDRGVDHENAALPMLLAVAAVHHHLIRAGKRMKVSLVADTGEMRDVHQLACLIGFGASAIHPWLAYETVREICERSGGEFELGQARINYRSALEAGLLKIMSKMGISVLGSYRGAQVFEAIGLSSKLVERCFTGTSSQIEGIGLPEIARETLQRHTVAYGAEELKSVPDLGHYRFRTRGEMHAVNPPFIKNFHTFVRSNAPEDYGRYVQAALAQRPLSLRDLLEFVPAPSGAVPLDEVEGIEEIRRRFTTAGMSLGAISPEAHECLAIAMNRIGGKSNSGEGGEDPERFHRRSNGDLANSAIKQIASARFGVNATYLASAKEIEIKMAQGAKPGEGGQLPGHKVSALIARLRNATEGVTLISPPPHHDIYSIEDLAQLIHDLKQVNPRARVCVKLVAEAGVGTIAAGVAKAHADIILISGHEGGTGASPLSSIKHAGSAWELGVAEAHQVLMLNGLRQRVTLRTDGGMRTGTDIVAATLLGAEEYNFGTSALIASGCVYVRMCHLNTCPVGIATLDEKFRAKFKGRPENIVHYFNAVAGEVRELMARLGYRTINEMVGRVDSLRQRHIPDHPKANLLSLKRLLADVAPKDDPDAPRHHTRERNDAHADRPLDDTILQDANDAINRGHPLSLNYKIRNVHRSTVTKVSGEIAYQKGIEGLGEDGLLELNFNGTAGQSFAAFLVRGLRVVLNGEANDYVGKGMSGGVLVVRPPVKRQFEPGENQIVGNTCLYGATGGEFFAHGRAGERFAVRNSGATAVIEGAGDHCCEYMTNGCVVVLGRTGRNFGAGMTGGEAFVLDPAGDFETRYNPQLIVAQRLSEGAAEARLRELVRQHAAQTGSERAQTLLEAWPTQRGNFWRIVPKAPPPPKANPTPTKPVEVPVLEPARA